MSHLQGLPQVEIEVFRKGDGDDFSEYLLNTRYVRALLAVTSNSLDRIQYLTRSNAGHGDSNCTSEFISKCIEFGIHLL